MMKQAYRLFLATLIFCAGSGVSAQNSQKTPLLPPTPTSPATKLERFQARTGVVVIKNYMYVGTVTGTAGAVRVQAVDLLDAQSQRHQYGIILEVDSDRSIPGRSQAFIDYDEIDSLIQGTVYLSRITGETMKLPIFEARYSSLDGLSIVVFNRRNGELEAAVELDGIGQERALLSLNDIGKLRELIIGAKLKLDSIK